MKRPWVAIQRNPTSGTGTRRGVLLELIRELKRHGIRPRLFASRERMQAKLADPARESNSSVWSRREAMGRLATWSIGIRDCRSRRCRWGQRICWRSI